MTIYDWSKVPQEKWEQLGHELAHPDHYADLRAETLQAIQVVLAAAETPAPLRTRAEVDAEIASLVRTIVDAVNPNYEAAWRRIRGLCREPTALAPEPECAYCVPHLCPEHQPLPTAQRALDSDKPELQDPEPCGCEETDALRERLKSIADWVLDAQGAVKNIRRLAGKP